MRLASPALIALLAGNQFVMADLYTFTFPGGSILRFSDRPTAINANGFVFQLGPKFERSRTKTNTGIQVDELTVNVYPELGDLIGTTLFLQALWTGQFDGALLQLERAFMPTYGDTSPGTVVLFAGRISTIDTSRTGATISVRSHLELLNIQMPRRLWQPSCTHIFGGPMCLFNRSTMALTFAATSPDGTISTAPSGTALTTRSGSWTWGGPATGRPGEFNLNLNDPKTYAWDPTRNNSGQYTFSNNNRTLSKAATTDSSVFWTSFRSSGKWIFSFIVTFAGTNLGAEVGFANANALGTSGNYVGVDGNGFGVTEAGEVVYNGAPIRFVTGYSHVSGDQVDMAIDLTNKLFWIRSTSHPNWNGNATFTPGDANGQSFSAMSSGNFVMSPGVDLTGSAGATANVGIPPVISGFPPWDSTAAPIGIGIAMEAANGGQLYLNTLSLGWFVWTGSGFVSSSPPGAQSSTAIQINGAPVTTTPFVFGTITGLTGANAGYSRTIYGFASGGFVSIKLAFLFPIAVGDTFQILPGCDKTASTCLTKFGNLIHFGGFPYIPTPESAV